MAAMTNHGIYLYGSHQKACGAWTGVKAQRFGVRFVVRLEYSALEYQATLGLIRESTDIRNGDYSCSLRGVWDVALSTVSGPAIG